MPRRISAEEAARLGAVPIEPPAPRRKMTAAEARAAGAVPVRDEAQQLPTEPDLGVADSPLRKALAADSGDVVEVQTPTGPAKFDRQGRRVFSSAESQQAIDQGDANIATRALNFGVGALSHGALHSIPFVSGVGAAARRVFAPASLPSGLAREDIISAYQRQHDLTEKTTRQAEDEGGLPAALLGVAPSLMVGAPTALGRIGVNALLGTVSGGFSSPAKPFQGEIAPVVSSMAKTGALSGALAGGGELLGKGFGYLGRKAGEQAGLAERATVDAERAALDKAANSARGALGGETSSGARTLEQAAAAVVDPTIDPAVKAAAQTFLSSPEALALRNQVLKNSLERGGGQLGRIEGAAQKYAEASTDLPGRAASQAAAKLDPAAVAKNLTGRFTGSIGQRIALGVGGYAGGSALDAVTGGEKGGQFGAALGLIAPGGLQMMRNAVKYAPAQALANRLTQGIAGAESAAAPIAGAAIGRVLKQPKDQADEDAIAAWLDQ